MNPYLTILFTPILFIKFKLYLQEAFTAYFLVMVSVYHSLGADDLSRLKQKMKYSWNFMAQYFFQELFCLKIIISRWYFLFLLEFCLSFSGLIILLHLRIKRAILCENATGRKRFSCRLSNNENLHKFILNPRER